MGGLREVLSESVLHPLLEDDCMQSVRDGRVTQLIMTGTSDVCCCRLVELIKMEWRGMCTRRENEEIVDHEVITRIQSAIEGRKREDQMDFCCCIDFRSNEQLAHQLRTCLSLSRTSSFPSPLVLVLVHRNGRSGRYTKGRSEEVAGEREIDWMRRTYGERFVVIVISLRFVLSTVLSTSLSFSLFELSKSLSFPLLPLIACLSCHPTSSLSFHSPFYVRKRFFVTCQHTDCPCWHFLPSEDSSSAVKSETGGLFILLWYFLVFFPFLPFKNVTSAICYICYMHVFQISLLPSFLYVTSLRITQVFRTKTYKINDNMNNEMHVSEHGWKRVENWLSAWIQLSRLEDILRSHLSPQKESESLFSPAHEICPFLKTQIEDITATLGYEIKRDPSISTMDPTISTKNSNDDSKGSDINTNGERRTFAFQAEKEGTHHDVLLLNVRVTWNPNGTAKVENVYCQRWVRGGIKELWDSSSRVSLDMQIGRGPFARGSCLARVKALFLSMHVPFQSRTEKILLRFES